MPDKEKPRLLVAEDDGALRRLLAEILSEDYEITVVTTGRELYALLCACRDLYDVLITDVVMPHWHGPEGVAMARTFGVDLPTIYVSGWMDPELVADLGDAEFVAKPFSRQQLLDALERVLHFKTA